MTSQNPTNHDHGAQAPEAELLQAEPAPAHPEGHDARPAGSESPAGDDAAPAGADAAPERDAAAAAAEPSDSTETPEPGMPEPESPEPESPQPAEAYAVAGEELEALTARAAKADEYLSLAQRTQADFENYRKRSVREVAVAQERGAVKLAMGLLPAVDNLERALEHAESDPENPGDLVAGIKHVHADIVDALQKAGIERYSPEGEPFDPTLHEAVAQQPIEGAEPGSVVEVFQRGYRIGETVVRPARVVVAG